MASDLIFANYRPDFYPKSTEGRKRIPKETEMEDTSLYGNGGMIGIGGRNQSRRWRDYSISMPDFQIPHRDLPFISGRKKENFVLFRIFIRRTAAFSS
jgi:hypothetical protein